MVKMICVWAFIAAVVALGCASVPRQALRASMPDEELRTTINQHFRVGMNEADVRRELAVLKVRDRDLRLYDAVSVGGIDRPRVVFARVWPAGGRWIDDTTSRLDWIDLSFVMSAPDRLDDVRAFRDGIVYSPEGGRLGGPTRVRMPTSWSWPQEVPFPKDPLEATESVLIKASSMREVINGDAPDEARGSERVAGAVAIDVVRKAGR
jgi:hypothetical protein